LPVAAALPATLAEVLITTTATTLYLVTIP
jgi:hypothetical protein